MLIELIFDTALPFNMPEPAEFSTFRRVDPVACIHDSSRSHKDKKIISSSNRAIIAVSSNVRADRYRFSRGAFDPVWQIDGRSNM